jgi:hypothetical protein
MMKARSSNRPRAILAALGLASCAAPDERPDLGELEIENTFVTTYSTFDFPAGTFFNKDILLGINRDPGTGANLFFSQQFAIEGSGGYIGLQTDGVRPDGSVGKLAVFSIWDAIGATAGSPGSWCQAFGGEGVGQSCRIAYDWLEARNYRLRVWAFGQNSWGGWILDTATGVETFLGTIDTPAHMGWLVGASTPFGEYYGPDFATCGDLRLGNVVWHNPTANDGAIGSTLASNSIGGGACGEVRRSDGAGPTVHSIGSRVVPGCGALASGQRLMWNEAIASCDGRFALLQQQDGNLVLYQIGVGALWESGTAGAPVQLADMQADGNLVLRHLGGAAGWQSGTAGHGNAWLAVQDDGNAVLYAPGGVPIWSTGTCCR